MYRLAAVYACGGRNVEAAKRYLPKVPPKFRGTIGQWCLQEGLDVTAP